MKQVWLNELKVAIIEEDVVKIENLMEVLPAFTKQKEIQEGLVLVQEAVKLVSGLKEETAISMRQLKKNIHYLQSTEHTTSKRLDITS